MGYCYHISGVTAYIPGFRTVYALPRDELFFNPTTHGLQTKRQAPIAIYGYFHATCLEELFTGDNCNLHAAYTLLNQPYYLCILMTSFTQTTSSCETLL